MGNPCAKPFATWDIAFFLNERTIAEKENTHRNVRLSKTLHFEASAEMESNEFSTENVQALTENLRLRAFSVRSRRVHVRVRL